MTIEIGDDEQVLRARRRAFGQFFTPPALARLMADWCLAGGARTLLDPAVGTGVLVREAVQLQPALQITAYDCDPAMLAACASVLPPASDLRCADFLLEANSESYDAIVSNPPYLGYKWLPYGSSIFDRFDERFGIRINRQSNLYAFFILEIARHLAPGGRAAVLVPSDWLNGNFGVPLKTFLLHERLLDGLLVFDQRSLLFDDSLATACLVLLRRGRSVADAIRFAYLYRQPECDEKDLDSFIAKAGVAVDYDSAVLQAEQKWLPLLPSLEPENPLLPNLVPLTSVAGVGRGIATGANHFFVLSADQVRKLGLEPSLFTPCLARASHAQLFDITLDDMKRLRAEGRRMLLLDPPPGSCSPALARYLRHGQEQGVDRRYLPAHRRPWYRAEQRPRAPILVTTFGRGANRFILNRSLVAHLTAFHGIILHRDLHTEDLLYERALMSYLVTPLGASALRQQQRRYGAGLLKCEPADVAQMSVPDLRRLDRRALKRLALLFDRCCLELRVRSSITILALLERRWRQVLS